MDYARKDTVKGKFLKSCTEECGNLWLNSMLDRSGAKMLVPKRYKMEKATAV